MVGGAVAALLVIGGTVVAVTGGDDEGGGKKSRWPAERRPEELPHLLADHVRWRWRGRENLNKGRQPGEAKVLWYKPAPDAPASGADAPGMWITGDTAVKAAYKQVFAFHAGDGGTALGAGRLPQKICAVTPQKSADDKIVVAYLNGGGDRAKCNQLQQLDLRTGEKGLDRRGRRRRAVRQRAQRQN